MIVLHHALGILQFWLSFLLKLTYDNTVKCSTYTKVLTEFKILFSPYTCVDSIHKQYIALFIASHV